MEKFVNYLKSDSNASNQFIKGVMRENWSNEEYWEEVVPLLDFSDSRVENWVLENIELFNLKYLTKYGHNLTPKVLDHILENLDLVERDDLIRSQHLNSEQLELYIELVGETSVNWNLIQEFQNLKEDLVNKYEKYLDWDLISENQFMDLKFLLVNKSKISWALIPINIHLQPIINQSFLKLFGDTNIWDGIGWLDSEIITVDVLINEFGPYLTYKAIKTIYKAKADELTQEQRDKLNQLEHSLR
jgi:hypothetical protein